MTHDKATNSGFVLPPHVVTKGDIARLGNELERVDSELSTASVQAKAGVEVTATPRLSDSLKAFLDSNDYTIEDSLKRSELIKNLRDLKHEVPVVHMTFAADADTKSLQKLVEWLRKEVHPMAVIEAGLQPSLIAGVYMRTPNRVHDLSLRAALADRREYFIDEMEALRGKR